MKGLAASYLSAAPAARVADELVRGEGKATVEPVLAPQAVVGLGAGAGHFNDGLQRSRGE